MDSLAENKRVVASAGFKNPGSKFCYSGVETRSLISAETLDCTICSQSIPIPKKDSPHPTTDHAISLVWVMDPTTPLGQTGMPSCDCPTDVDCPNAFNALAAARRPAWKSSIRTDDALFIDSGKFPYSEELILSDDTDRRSIYP